MIYVKAREHSGYLTEKMEACGMESTLDPCQFIGKKVMCICYVDDLIFLALDEADIDELGCS